MIKRKNNKWLLATNTDNMRSIIAQGLITGMDGFEKYYSDYLEIVKNYIPVFKNKLPSDVLNRAVSEDESLTTCIIEFNLNVIHGVVKTLNETNNIIDIDIMNVDEYSIVFIPAPLPLACIERIIFKNTKERVIFENDAKLYRNVPLIDIKLQSNKTDEKLFINTELQEIDITNINTIDFISNNIINYPKIYSYGGLLATLFYSSKNGSLSNEFYHSISNSTNIDILDNKDIQYIANYFKDVNTDDNILMQMYYLILDVTINTKKFKEDVLEFLENFEIPGYHNRTVEIANRLIQLESTIDKTVSEQFKEAKTSIEKVLLMLFFRKNSKELIEYRFDALTEEDHLLFLMMFGIRDKFINIPKFIREFSGLQNDISLKMANYAHLSMNSSISFRVSKKSPPTLIDMFKLEEFKKWFAKEQKIESYFKTKIDIPKGSYSFNITTSGVQIIFDGIIKAPSTEIVEKDLFNFMSTFSLYDYNKILSKYEKIK